MNIVSEIWLIERDNNLEFFRIYHSEDNANRQVEKLRKALLGKFEAIKFVRASRADGQEGGK